MTVPRMSHLSSVPSETTDSPHDESQTFNIPLDVLKKITAAGVDAWVLDEWLRSVAVDPEDRKLVDVEDVDGLSITDAEVLEVLARMPLSVPWTAALHEPLIEFSFDFDDPDTLRVLATIPERMTLRLVLLLDWASPETKRLAAETILAEEERQSPEWQWGSDLNEHEDAEWCEVIEILANDLTFPTDLLIGLLDIPITESKFRTQAMLRCLDDPSTPAEFFDNLVGEVVSMALCVTLFIADQWEEDGHGSEQAIAAGGRAHDQMVRDHHYFLLRAMTHPGISETSRQLAEIVIARATTFKWAPSEG